MSRPAALVTSRTALAATVAAIAVLFAPAIGGGPGAPVAGPVVRAGIFLLMTPFLLSGSPEVGALVRRCAGRAGVALGLAVGMTLPGILLLASRSGPGDPAAPAAATLYGVLPLLLMAWARRAGSPPRAADWLAVAAAWLPVEFGLFGERWPFEGVGFPAPLATWLCACVLLAGFTTVRPLEGIGFRWRLRLEDLAVGGVAFVAVIAVMLPALMVLGRAATGRTVDPFPQGMLGLLSLVLFTVLPAEILFRGLIFNLLQRLFVSRHGPRPALLISAALFGLSVAGGGSGAGLWPIAFAAYAGLWYGWCYLRTGGLTASVLAHAGALVLQRFVLESMLETSLIG